MATLAEDRFLPNLTTAFRQIDVEQDISTQEYVNVKLSVGEQRADCSLFAEDRRKQTWHTSEGTSQ